MTYNIVNVRHSGQSLFGSTNKASQYGDPDVATTAILQRHLVCSDEAQGRVSSPSLSLPSPGTKQSGAAAGAASQSSFHCQLASPLDPASPSPLPPAAPAHQPLGRRGVAAVAGTTFRSWLKAGQKLLCDAFYTTSQTVMPRKSWLRFTISWRLRPTQGVAI